MSVGQRLRDLRESYGESLREASRRTGVPHYTLSRIERGQVTQAYRATLSKIAAGYGVSVEYFVGGRDYATSLGAAIRSDGPAQRLELMLSPARRIRHTLCLLLTEHGFDFPLAQVAQMAGLPTERLHAYVAGHSGTSLPPMVLQQLANALNRLAVLSPAWLDMGCLVEEDRASYGAPRLQGISGPGGGSQPRRARSLRARPRQMAHGIYLPN